MGDLLLYKVGVLHKCAREKRQYMLLYGHYRGALHGKQAAGSHEHVHRKADASYSHQRAVQSLKNPQLIPHDRTLLGVSIISQSISLHTEGEIRWLMRKPEAVP